MGSLCILQIGTYQMAVMAKALNKPFYVVAESFKFVRMYPLNQGDLPNDEKVIAGVWRKTRKWSLTLCKMQPLSSGLLLTIL